MISSNIKSTFEVEKLHSIPRIRELATHGSHENTTEKKRIILVIKGSSRQIRMLMTLQEKGYLQTNF